MKPHPSNAYLLNGATRSGWEATAIPPPPTPPIKADSSCEALVNGAGYTELNAAIRLAEAGIAAIVVETGAPGYLTTMMATPWIWRLQVFGSKAWVHMRCDTALEVRRIVNADDRYLDRKPEVISFPPCDTERMELESFARAVSSEGRFPVEAQEVINGAFVMDSAIECAG